MGNHAHQTTHLSRIAAGWCPLCSWWRLWCTACSGWLCWTTWCSCLPATGATYGRPCMCTGQRTVSVGGLRSCIMCCSTCSACVALHFDARGTITLSRSVYSVACMVAQCMLVVMSRCPELRSNPCCVSRLKCACVAVCRLPGDAPHGAHVLCSVRGGGVLHRHAVPGEEQPLGWRWAHSRKQAGMHTLTHPKPCRPALTSSKCCREEHCTWLQLVCQAAAALTMPGKQQPPPTTCSCCSLCCLQSISDCDSNPLTRNYLSSPVPIASFKILALKMVMVIVSTVLDTVPQAQPIVSRG
jgi:hypothetical protein